MLGVLLDKWDKSKSVDVKEGDKFIVVRGKRLEVKLEDENNLRLSLVEFVDNRDEQHDTALSVRMNTLKQRRKDVALIERELQEIARKLDSLDLEEDVENDLEGQARDRRAIKRLHMREIMKLEAETTVKVNYRVSKTGLTAVLPPGLTLHPKFLVEPVCWCPTDVPKCMPLEEVTTMVEEMSLTCAQHTTAEGSGVEHCLPDEESKFVISAKDFDGKPCGTGGDKFVLESKETEIKYSVIDKKNGLYEISYSRGDAEIGGKFSLAVTFHGQPIQGSPFSVKTHPLLLLEFSSTGNYGKDWLLAAVAKMSNIPRARLWVTLEDVNGSIVYTSTGVTSNKWTKDRITAPGRQYWDDKHTNAIPLDNGDRMMIIGEQRGIRWRGAPYWRHTIIINAGWDTTKLNKFEHPRRMILGFMIGVPGWTDTDNRISFSSAGFIQTSSGNWPKFRGTFRIFYMPF